MFGLRSQLHFLPQRMLTSTTPLAPTHMLASTTPSAFARASFFRSVTCLIASRPFLLTRPEQRSNLLRWFLLRSRLARAGSPCSFFFPGASLLRGGTTAARPLFSHLLASSDCKADDLCFPPSLFPLLHSHAFCLRFVSPRIVRTKFVPFRANAAPNCNLKTRHRLKSEADECLSIVWGWGWAAHNANTWTNKAYS